jgi:hypothetical protein
MLRPLKRDTRSLTPDCCWERRLKRVLGERVGRRHEHVGVWMCRMRGRVCVVRREIGRRRGARRARLSILAVWCRLSFDRVIDSRDGVVVVVMPGSALDDAGAKMR